MTRSSRAGAPPQETGALGSRSPLQTADGTFDFVRVDRLDELGICATAELPRAVRILLEGLLRRRLGMQFDDAEIARIAAAVAAPQAAGPPVEIPFLPARTLLQDFTGLPALVDLAAMRTRLAAAGADAAALDLALPADLVIDHSARADYYGTSDARTRNLAAEYERNAERYAFLRWAEQAFDGLRVVPPGRGICHQVNFERLAEVVSVRPGATRPLAIPDTVLGSDSHTTMINGLGVLGWGVGGIEIEAAMLGRPLTLLRPRVVGLRLDGSLPVGVLATDLALRITELLRAHGVVDVIVEVFGPGVAMLSVPDRGVIANMAPDYGATACLFGVDERTLSFLRLTNRGSRVDVVDAYVQAQGLSECGQRSYDDVVELDLGTVQTALAGPDRPDQRRALADVPASYAARTPRPRAGSIGDGTVALAAITSCTNTSNPEAMLAAGLVARKAVARGVQVPPWVKTSLAPGSAVVAAYLDKAGLTGPLEQLGFAVVGFGCTTCCGNSGDLAADVEVALAAGDPDVVAVLSGNRNYASRIHPRIAANYLASPPLVVAYALAGRIDLDLSSEPLGRDAAGRPVRLEELWPTTAELEEAHAVIQQELFADEYAALFDGGEPWNALALPEGPLYPWDEESTFLRPPPFVEDADLEPGPLADLHDARALLVLGDHVTTDHISPVGRILVDSPAGEHLATRGVAPGRFDSFGARRGNWEVMKRGTFDYLALENALVAPATGGLSRHLPSGAQGTIYATSVAYGQTPLVILAGEEYGAGSSRDWAAKGTALLGVRAVLAASFERIHRANLIGMGVVPLELPAGRNLAELGLDGTECFTLLGLDAGAVPGGEVTISATSVTRRLSFVARSRVDTEQERRVLLAGGILPSVLIEHAAGEAA